MKPALIALIAALSLPSAASAAPKVENAGPFRTPKNQIACQNLGDYNRIKDAQVLKNRAEVQEMWAKRSGPGNEPHQLLCIAMPKSTTVTVASRWIGYECVNIQGRPSSACFYIENVSGTKRPDYAPDLYWNDYY